MEPTLPDEFRTWDPLSQSECGDWTKYNPWRAPGKAPVADSCGIASGFSQAQAYVEVPEGYTAGDKGSEVLPAQEKTTWQAGATAKVGWALSAQHGGGHSYRLCPKGHTLDEECFQSNTLKFSGSNSTIHFHDGSHADITIPTRTYTAPDGTEWRTNPIPGCACDVGIACGGKSQDMGNHAHDLYATSENCVGEYPKSDLYAKHGKATDACPHGTMFEPGFTQFTQGFLTNFAGQTGGNTFSVMDDVHVPSKVGEYVLGWRWDCEETDQVWNSCADIVIVDGATTTAPQTTVAPAPAPTPSPSPSPAGKCKAIENPTCKNIDFTAEKACYFHGCEECEDDTGANCNTCCEGCELQTYGDLKYCSASKVDGMTV